MKKIFDSFCMAFSCYSIAPNSKQEKCRDNSEYALLFLPLIGLIIGAIINRWGVAYPYLCNYSIFPAVVAAMVPTILSSGSHLEGFFRTVDALGSHKSKEDKLKILNEDAHVGYMSIIVCICYFMIFIAVWSEFPVDGFFIVAFQYVISRALFGISLLLMPHACEGKATNMVPESRSNRTIQAIILLLYIIVCCFFILSINSGVAKAMLCGAAISFVYYVFVAKHYFGGTLEQLGGFFVTISEVIMPICALIMYKKWF